MYGLWLCTPLQVWEHGRQKRTESTKNHIWMRCSGMDWWEIGACKVNLCKPQKEEIIHRTGKGLRSYWCEISLLWIMGKEHIFGSLFLLCNISSPEGLRANFPRVTEPASEIRETKLDWEDCFSCPSPARQIKVACLIQVIQGHHLTLEWIQCTNFLFVPTPISK